MKLPVNFKMSESIFEFAGDVMSVIGFIIWPVSCEKGHSDIANSVDPDQLPCLWPESALFIILEDLTFYL